MRSIIIAATATVALFSSPVFAQQPNQGEASIPDFSGVWSHPYLPSFEPPARGPSPVTNRSRLRDGPQRGVSNPSQPVGHYTNPILKPAAAETVKRYGELSLSGVTYPTPSSQCWPAPLPYIFNQHAMEMIQQPDRITILYIGYPSDHEVRHIRMNEPHPAQVVPSWYGDSVIAAGARNAAPTR
jgi:hypothetical protein